MIRNRSSIPLLESIPLTDGYCFQAGTSVTVDHYRLGLTPDGFVKPDELLIRVEDKNGRVVHVWRGEIEALELLRAAE
jgi:hypothetical protein